MCVCVCVCIIYLITFCHCPRSAHDRNSFGGKLCGGHDFVDRCLVYCAIILFTAIVWCCAVFIIHLFHKVIVRSIDWISCARSHKIDPRNRAVRRHIVRDIPMTCSVVEIIHGIYMFVLVYPIV